VEEGRTNEVIGRPLHPYTRGLLNSIPKIGSKAKINAIPGIVPDLMGLTEACPFAPRCDCQTGDCSRKVELIEIEEGRYVRCRQNL
jgi:oligopeptide/dipeptide ABC transporter ATP-binding protein